MEIQLIIIIVGHMQLYSQYLTYYIYVMLSRLSLFKLMEEAKRENKTKKKKKKTLIITNNETMILQIQLIIIDKLINLID